MQYIPKLPDDSVNIPKGSFLIETIKLVVGLVVFVVIIYSFLWLSMAFIANTLSPNYEQKLQKIFKNDLTYSDDNRTKYLQSIVDTLNACANLPYNIKVFIVKDNRVNAYAMLGGNIIVTTAMLDNIKNENELTFVLGHEMGHFKNKDHLMGIGNALIITFVSMFMGSDYGEILNMSLMLTNTKFSQTQEINADWFGVKMLMCKYKNIVSATTLFERMQEEDILNHYFSTHPGFKKRIDVMKEKIKKNEFPNYQKTIKLKYSRKKI